MALITEVRAELTDPVTHDADLILRSEIGCHAFLLTLPASVSPKPAILGAVCACARVASAANPPALIAAPLKKALLVNDSFSLPFLSVVVCVGQIHPSLQARRAHVGEPFIKLKSI
jgi:hypothetical protein